MWIVTLRLGARIAALGPRFCILGEFSTPVEDPVDKKANAQRRTRMPGAAVDTSDVTTIWKRCVADVQTRLTTPASRAWFEETEALALTHDAITLKAPNSFAKEWLEHRYANLLADALRRACGRELRVDILAATPSGTGPLPVPILQAITEPGRTEDESGTFNPRYNFETFV